MSDIVVVRVPTTTVVESQVDNLIVVANTAVGSPGAPGVGVPAGGTAGQVLSKIDSTDYNTQWVTGGGGGSGTVTQFNFTNGAGITGVVTNATSTPTLALTLGAITPTTIVASSTISGSNLSGTNTGDQTSVSGNAGTATKLATARTIAMTGDVVWTSPAFDGSANVTASGTIQASSVTLAKMADVGTATVFYRKTAGTGAPETQTLATLKTDLGLTGTNSGDQTITLTGGVTGSGTGSFAATVVTNANLTGDVTSVGNASTVVKLNGTSLAGLGTGLLKNTTGTGVPSIAINSDLPVMSATVGGAVPTPPNNTTTFLRGDGTFATPAGGGQSAIQFQEEGSNIGSSGAITVVNFTGPEVTASVASTTLTIDSFRSISFNVAAQTGLMTAIF